MDAIPAPVEAARNHSPTRPYRTVERQSAFALGLREHAAAVEIGPAACATLRLNRPEWNVIEDDVANIESREYRGVDLVAGGVPCPPFSIAGQRLGADDERDLFPEALRLIDKAKPRAVLLENVRGLATSKFASYRAGVESRLHELGYATQWQVINASEHGVAQLRPRFVLAGVLERYGQAGLAAACRHAAHGRGSARRPHGRGWMGTRSGWRERAGGIGPTLVGGSRKHGGPDLGPTRAREEWVTLGVNGKTLANEPPPADAPHDLMPALTVRMTARLQGFPDAWEFFGRQTAAYRQIGSAFPAPVARAMGLARWSNNCSFYAIRPSCRACRASGRLRDQRQAGAAKGQTTRPFIKPVC